MSELDVKVYGTSGTLEYAVYGTTLPTNTSDALDGAFKDCGEISGEEGIEESLEADAEVVARNFKGEPIAIAVAETTETYTITFLEENENVLELVRGVDVESQLGNRSRQYGGRPDVAPKSVVITLLANDGEYKRVVIPRAVITAREPVMHSNSESAKYTVTLTALYDSTLGYTKVTYLDDDLTS